MKKLWMFIVLLLVPWGALAQEMVIIVHNDNQVAEISQRDLKNIFLGKKSQWEDGSMIQPIILNEELLHGTFLKSFLKRGKKQYETYWKRMIFTGQGSPPKSGKTEADILDFVAKNPGAIGYISTKADRKEFDIKVVDVQ